MAPFLKSNTNQLLVITLLLSATIAVKITAAYSTHSNQQSNHTNTQTQADDATSPGWRSDFEKADRMIEKRETEASSLPEAISMLTQLAKRFPHISEIWALLAKGYYYSGSLSTSKSKMLDDYQRGLHAAKKSIEINPKNVDGHFWYGVNLGRTSTTRWGFSQLRNVREIIFRMQKVIELDPNFADGAPYLVLGRVYLEAPGRPFSIGSRKKALQNLQKALRIRPSYYETHFYLMELYELEGERELASVEADWLVNDEFHNSYPISAQSIKRKAQEILAKYRRKK